jgi:NAD(P)-dependent dehydrogenase (short-subunit alcohol dehydrogenase family)
LATSVPSRRAPILTVNALAPGLVVTQSNIEAMKPSPQEIREKWVSLDHIVEAAMFLVTPAGSRVNGVILPVQARGI